MKKILAILLAAVVITVCFYSCTSPSPETVSYNMFRGNAKHTGVYPSAEAGSPPHVKWKFKTKGYVNSSPAIAGDKIYFGSGDSNLYCVNINSGSLAWTFKTGGAVHSSPAIANNTVYFGSHDGNFYALNAEDGKVKWTFKTPGEKLYSGKNLHGQEPKDSLFVDEWDFWLSSPVVYNNKVYFGSGSGDFYALDAKTGQQVWSFKTDGIIHSSPAIAFGNVYFGGWDTYMHALDAETGKAVWKFKTGVDTVTHNQTGITGSALISGDLLYFGCRDSYLYALDAKSGKLAWKKFNDHGWISLTPVAYGNKLIYSSGSSRKFIALDKLTGNLVYQKTIKTGVFASPSIAGETVYQGDFLGVMTAMDVNSGTAKWTFETDGLKNDIYGLLDKNHGVDDHKYEAAIKKYKGQKQPLEIFLSIGCILSSPVIKDKVIYFGATDGYMYALQK